MRFVAICFFTVIALAFVAFFKEHMPGPLGKIGYEIAGGLDHIVQFMKDLLLLDRGQGR